LSEHNNLMNTPSSRNSCLLTLFSLAVALAPVTTAQVSPPAFAFKFGGLGSGNSQFNYPAGISTDSSGNLYVADSYNFRVKKFSSSGGFQAAVWIPLPANHWPGDAVADGNGNLFVIDNGLGAVTEFRISDGAVVRSFGYLTGRGGVAMDPDGNILATDNQFNYYTTCRCVKKYKSDGSSTIWQSQGNGFNWPVDVSVDTNGNVFVADQGNYRIVKLDGNGNYLTNWGSSGTGDGQFKIVRGVAVDASDRVYVAEDNNSGGHGRVQVFSSSGTFLTKWGSYDPGDTTFGCPVSVAFSHDGRVVYVSDYGTHEIKVFTYNAAPVLDDSKTPTLAPVAVNAGAPSGMVGMHVTSLVDIGGALSNVSDPDAGALTGVAITAAAAASGTWYFSTNNGATWTALGTPSPTSARLLIASSGSRVYFQPNPGFTGTVPSALTFRAWDQAYGANGETADTSYSGGATAFSAATDTAAITVVVTPPAVTTVAATSVTGTNATLHASVNPNTASTDVTFQYSTDPSLAHATTTASQNIGSGWNPVAVSQPISGLLPSTTYYFRAVGNNLEGTTQGSILGFSLTLTLIQPGCAGTNFTFSFQSASNQAFTVESSSDPATTNWECYYTTTGDGSLMPFLIPMTNTTHRFFRVRQP
jgi:sugar lactone lactonase YvrE